MKQYSRLVPFLFALSTLVALSTPQTVEAVVARSVTSPFIYNFNSAGVLDEAGSMLQTTSPYLWLNSGGQFLMENGIGKTVQGALQSGLRWQLAYALANPLDTAKGTLPQNIFRLLTSSKWDNFTQEVAFKITKINMTDTPNRDSYSGILLFNRYKDGDNLYYTGIRQDGTAVIKKKINGTYHTMATAQVYNSDAGYDKDTNPNLIPGNRWIGLRSEIKDLLDGSVSIALYIDKANNGLWQKVVTVADSNGKYGGSSVIKGLGYVGIRSDYMDLWFENYKVVAL